MPTIRNPKEQDMSIFDGDEVTKVDPGRKILFDAIDAARRPDGFATMLVDLVSAKEFKDHPDLYKKYTLSRPGSRRFLVK